MAIAAEPGSATISRKVSDDYKAVATYRSAIAVRPAIETIIWKVIHSPKKRDYPFGIASFSEKTVPFNAVSGVLFSWFSPGVPVIYLRFMSP